MCSLPEALNSIDSTADGHSDDKKNETGTAEGLRVRGTVSSTAQEQV